jgi:hypothetical protein
MVNPATFGRLFHGISLMTAIFKAKVPTLMRQFMADFKCTKEDAAAVFGNAGHESGGFTQMQEIKPTMPGSRGGFGWFQWTGPRRKAFEAYCSRNNLSPTSDKANYGFLWVELHGSEKAAVSRLRNAKTLRDKVIEFELAYERAGIKHYDSRVRWANLALGAYEGSAGRLPEVKPTTAKKPTVSPGTKAATAGATVVVGGAGAAAASAGLSALQVIAIIAGASLVAGAALLIIYRITKGYWPWIGNQSQVLSLPSLPPSVKSSELDLVQSELSSVDLLAKPSPVPSEPKPRRKRLAKPSRQTRTPRKSSKGLKRSAAKKSSPKRKSKSRS